MLIFISVSPVVTSVLFVLRQPRKLTRLAMLSSLIPYFFSYILGFQKYITVALIFLLIVLYGHYIIELVKKVQESVWIMRLNYATFTVGMVGAMWFFYETLDLGASPVLNLVLAAAVYFNWQNRIVDKLGQFTYKPVFKAETTATRWSRQFGNAGSHNLIFVLILACIVLIDSFLSTNTREIISPPKLWWFIVLPIVWLHFAIHYLVVDQIEWQQATCSFRQFPPPVYPNSEDGLILGLFMEKVSHLNSPPEGFFDWLEGQLPRIGKRLSQHDYALFFHQIIYAFSYWGHQARNHLHLLHLTVVGTLKKYNMLGKIPLYNRYPLYEYLALMHKHGVRSERWQELITYVIEQDSSATHIGWVGQRPWNDDLGQYKWISYWNGHIYRGRQGYNLLSQLQPSSMKVPTDQWQADCWELAYRTLERFIGPDGGEIIRGDLRIVHALDFLTQHRSLVEYEEHAMEQRQQLGTPHQRYVGQTTAKKIQMTATEKRQMIEAYFDQGVEAISDDSEIEYPLIDRFKNALPSIMVYGGLAVAALFNILLIDVLNRVATDLGLLLFAIEFFYVTVMTLSGEPTGNDLQFTSVNKEGPQAKVSRSQNTMLTEYPDWNRRSVLFTYYMFALAIFYTILVN